MFAKIIIIIIIITVSFIVIIIINIIIIIIVIIATKSPTLSVIDERLGGRRARQLQSKCASCGLWAKTRIERNEKRRESMFI